MDWNVAASIAELISATAVVLSLIYLSMQVRQSNNLQSAQARYNLRVQRSQVASTIRDPFTLEALYKKENGEEISPAELGAIKMTALLSIETWEWQYGEYKAGMLRLEELPLAAWRTWFLGEGEVPIPIKDVWEKRKNTLNPDFVSFIEKNVINA